MGLNNTETKSSRPDNLIQFPSAIDVLSMTPSASRWVNVAGSLNFHVLRFGGFLDLMFIVPRWILQYYRTGKSKQLLSPQHQRNAQVTHGECVIWYEVLLDETANKRARAMP